MQPVAVETEMYGLPLPSPELLVDDQVRTWTNLTGLKVLATFDRVLAPGFLRLKQAGGATQEFRHRELLARRHRLRQTDARQGLARPVFPEGSGFQSLTPEDVGKGYRVWTDRRDVSLVGKFEGIKGKNVVIEKNGEKLEYALAGLSEADRTWIKEDQRRRAEEAAQRARQAAAERESERNSGGGRSPFSRSPFPRGPDAGGHGDGSSTFPRRRSSLFPEYKFHCNRCGHAWTGHSPISSCPNCKDTYEFHCNVCGHTWTRKNQLIDSCPNCNARRNESNARQSPQCQLFPGGFGFERPSASSTPTSTGSDLASAGNSAKEGQGVFLTIVYAGLGLGLLAGIAVGLFKAFG